MKNRSLILSQRPNLAGPSSQVRAATPLKIGNGSPKRKGSLGRDGEFVVPALTMAKSKREFSLISGAFNQTNQFDRLAKQFGQFNNAFATPPVVGNRGKRARTDAPETLGSPGSPRNVIGNGHKTPTRELSTTPTRMGSPLNPKGMVSPQVSPTKTRNGSPLVEREMDVDDGDIGWQPDFGIGESEVIFDVEEETRGEVGVISTLTMMILFAETLFTAHTSSVESRLFRSYGNNRRKRFKTY